MSMTTVAGRRTAAAAAAAGSRSPQSRVVQVSSRTGCTCDARCLLMTS